MQSLPQILAPRRGETVIDYWMSLSPAAPLFGIDWRFSPMFWHGPAETRHMPAAESAALLTEGDPMEAVEAATDAMEDAADEAADDLTQLKGVGPKLAAELNEMGLTTFAQIAEMTEANIQELSAQLSAFRDRPMRDDWVGQARKLMGAD
ncbi:hypothetical protein [Roseobacter sp. HKCCA0434]|uniref:hypothetical protein n=1 Tax=Roseobacter sp. HKCCA0434 TaxID=3079297 RepID=UPI0029058E8E|nr:hypothetical protein [Roseobacter sp. HKCCA0434]